MDGKIPLKRRYLHLQLEGADASNAGICTFELKVQMPALEQYFARYGTCGTYLPAPPAESNFQSPQSSNSQDPQAAF